MSASVQTTSQGASLKPSAVPPAALNLTRSLGLAVFVTMAATTCYVPIPLPPAQLGPSDADYDPTPNPEASKEPPRRGPIGLTTSKRSGLDGSAFASERPRTLTQNVPMTERTSSPGCTLTTVPRRMQ